MQAGGRGSRLGPYTENRPKCLIPAGGKPLLYRLGEAFPRAEVWIISDYREDVLARYLRTVPPSFKYHLVTAHGKGTCAGLEEVRRRIGKETPFALTWCDLLYGEPPRLPRGRSNYVGVTNAFPCRWRLDRGRPEERRSHRSGILGFFVLNRPEDLPPIPPEGEFVGFLRESRAEVQPLQIDAVTELGTLEAYNAYRSGQVSSRFFNDVRIEGSTVVKRARDPSFAVLLRDEVRWYRWVRRRGYPFVPKIRSYAPLRMERVRGFPPYEEGGRSPKEKASLLGGMLDALDRLHTLGSIPADPAVLKDVYLAKTRQRLERVRGVIPHATSRYVRVNGRRLENLLHPEFSRRIEALCARLAPQPTFRFIHGDPTFSNMMLKSNGSVRFFDPRGYFGTQKLFGDPRYDFAKLYYSAVGNYDAFNHGNFRVSFEGQSVRVDIGSSGWESTKSVFEKRFGTDLLDLERLHALIWLSLCGYVIEDYDGILASFYHGLELFHDVWAKG